MFNDCLDGNLTKLIQEKSFKINPLSVFKVKLLIKFKICHEITRLYRVHSCLSAKTQPLKYSSHFKWSLTLT